MLTSYNGRLLFCQKKRLKCSQFSSKEIHLWILGEKQPPTIPQVESSKTENVLNHRTIHHIVKEVNVYKAAGSVGTLPIVLNRCASESIPTFCSGISHRES